MWKTGNRHAFLLTHRLNFSAGLHVDFNSFYTYKASSEHAYLVGLLRVWAEIRCHSSDWAASLHVLWKLWELCGPECKHQLNVSIPAGWAVAEEQNLSHWLRSLNRFSEFDAELLLCKDKIEGKGPIWASFCHVNACFSNKMKWCWVLHTSSMEIFYEAEELRRGGTLKNDVSKAILVLFIQSYCICNNC